MTVGLNNTQQLKRISSNLPTLNKYKRVKALYLRHLRVSCFPSDFMSS
nr:MAG TPA: hypothetical protein [Caudoviricetes sp.]